MRRPPLAHKVKIVGRFIDLTKKTDVAATIARVRREQAEAQAKTDRVVTPIKKTAAGGRK